MHDEHARRRQFQALGVQAEIAEIRGIVERGRLRHALFLNPQHHDDVGAGNPILDAGEARGAAKFCFLRQQRLRSHQPQIRRPERGERLMRRPRDPRVFDVADDGHLEAGKAALVSANGQGVEQPLRGVRHMRLAGADHRHVRRHVVDQEFRHARFGIADHEHVGVHGLERINRVQHAFALGARTRVQVQIEHMRSQSAAGQVERGAGAGARLEEEVGESYPGELAALVGGLPRQAAVALRAIENRRQRIAREAVKRDEVAQAPGVVLL